MILFGPSTSKRRLPINLKDEGDLTLFENELERYNPVTNLLAFENIRVNSDSLIFKNIQILPYSFVNATSPPSYIHLRYWLQFLANNYLRRKQVKITKACIWFINDWSYNYFHWMTDAIPRLSSVMDLIPNATILLPYHYEQADYVKSSLCAFGVRDLMFVPDKEVFLVRHLLLPTETAVTGNYNDELIRSIRKVYRQFYSTKTLALTFGDKIYISRGKAQKRKIVNEHDVALLLEGYGFKKVYFEDLTFDEQASVSMNTKYLISNHGAGLTNMLFMSAGNFVFELRRQGDTDNNCYFSLASALSLKYLYQTCKAENETEDTYIANLIVDLRQLRDNVELMLSLR